MAAAATVSYGDAGWPGGRKWQDIPHCVIAACNVEEVLSQTIAATLVRESRQNVQELGGLVRHRLKFDKDDHKLLEGIQWVVDTVRNIVELRRTVEWEDFRSDISKKFTVPDLLSCTGITSLLETVGPEWRRKVIAWDELIFGLLRLVIQSKISKNFPQPRYSFADLQHHSVRNTQTLEINEDVTFVRETRNRVIHDESHSFNTDEEREEFKSRYMKSIDFCVKKIQPSIYPLTSQETYERLSSLQITLDNYVSIKQAYENEIRRNEDNVKIIKRLLNMLLVWKKRVDTIFQESINLSNEGMEYLEEGNTERATATFQEIRDLNMSARRVFEETASDVSTPLEPNTALNPNMQL